jgi:hypothetical protein
MLKQLTTMADLVKDGFEPIGDAHVEHFAAIGRFILSNSGIDAQLHSMLQTLLNGDYDAGRVLVGEMRTGDLISGIRHITAQQKLAANVMSEIEVLFSGISRLKAARDDLAHRACVVKGDALAFHNVLRAKTDNRIQVNYYSIAELNEFSRYAGSIDFRLRLLLPSLVPRDQTLNNALLTMAILTALLTVAMKVERSPDASKKGKDKLWLAGNAAIEANNAYTEAARKLEFKFADLKLASDKALIELANCLAQCGLPDDLASLDPHVGQSLLAASNRCK